MTDNEKIRKERLENMKDWFHFALCGEWKDKDVQPDKDNQCNKTD